MDPWHYGTNELDLKAATESVVHASARRHNQTRAVILYVLIHVLITLKWPARQNFHGRQILSSRDAVGHHLFRHTPCPLLFYVHGEGKNNYSEGPMLILTCLVVAMSPYEAVRALNIGY